MARMIALSWWTLSQHSVKLGCNSVEGYSSIFSIVETKQHIF